MLFKHSCFFLYHTLVIDNVVEHENNVALSAVSADTNPAHPLNRNVSRFLMPDCMILGLVGTYMTSCMSSCWLTYWMPNSGTPFAT